MVGELSEIGVGRRYSLVLFGIMARPPVSGLPAARSWHRPAVRGQRWSNLAAGRYGNSLVKRPPITTSSRSAFLRSHHVPWRSNVDCRLAGVRRTGTPRYRQNGRPVASDFHAALAHWTVRNALREPLRLPREVLVRPVQALVIQASAARATTVIGSSAANVDSAITGTPRTTRITPSSGHRWALAGRYRTSRRPHWPGSRGRISRRCADSKPPTLTKRVIVPSWLSSILGTSLYRHRVNPFSDMCVLGKVPERFPGSLEGCPCAGRDQGPGWLRRVLRKTRPDAART